AGDPDMSAPALVTDDDLARARLDPAFRHRLVELNKLRARTGADPNRAGQIREGRRSRRQARRTAAMGRLRPPPRRLSGVGECLAFSPKMPINPASARSRPGAERTAADDAGGRVD